MCGRYVSPEEAAVERAWHIGRRNWKTPFGKPRYNVAPTMRVIMLRRDAASPEIELAHARWGFVPYWWKEAKPPLGRFNAKVETAGANGMWREALSRARCLLPALGWYEWREEERIDKATGEVVKVNQPYYITRKDRRPLCFAGGFPSGHEPREAQRPAVLAGDVVGLIDLHDLARRLVDAFLLAPFVPAERGQQIGRARQRLAPHAVRAGGLDLRVEPAERGLRFLPPVRHESPVRVRKFDLQGSGVAPEHDDAHRRRDVVARLAERRLPVA